MKLLDILREANSFLKKPEQIYAPGQEPEEITSDISKLTPQQRKELFKRGSLLIPKPQDPSRPSTISSKVVRLPKAEEIQRKLINDKKEFEAYQYHPDEDIKKIAKEINKLYNQLYGTIKALDKTLELKKLGKL